MARQRRILDKESRVWFNESMSKSTTHKVAAHAVLAVHSDTWHGLALRGLLVAWLGWMNV
jgi:hypothetical protein